ncbi:unnamed protein product [Brassicogethes aeneus]|uniref:Glucose-methanol-choline oxidoreductase N-terminal domain-containing protein n=1 Tax=Brassicogethes aeneus TaxID=1431903 RepID=A0A9P0FJU7_BRAAE|nr:unnamed protein product [Brassicogethes aeneus]
MILLVILAGVHCQNHKDLVEEYEDRISKAIKDTDTYTLDTDAYRYKPKSNEIKYFGEFDYIVIGAGTAGSVVASRLSETPSKRVLLLEAGKAPSTVTEVPQLAGQAAFSDYNWGFYSTPQKQACQGYKDNRCAFARGRGAGGSSLISYSVYSRFSFYDMQRLSNLTGYEWTIDCYKKSENFTQTNADAIIEQSAHGTTGPWHVENAQTNNVRSDAFRDANEECGQPLRDYNTVFHEVGVDNLQLNKKHGKRADTFTDFVMPVMDRSNLNVSLESYVVRVEIDAESKSADSVLFTKNNVLYRVKATKEIIVSGGTVNSPQILQLSGVGRPALLNKFNISVVQDLAVGENLRDHVALVITMSHNVTDEGVDLKTAVEEFLDNKGVLTAASVDWVAFYDSTRGEYPDMELVIMPNLPTPVPEMDAKLFNFAKEAMADMIASTPPKVFRFLAILLDTESVGSVSLQSDSPFDYPLINNNILSETEDLEKLYTLINIVRNLTRTEGFKRIDAKLVTPKLSACKGSEFDSKDYWLCVFRQFGLPGYHCVGSCPLGKDPKKGAVVDPQFKVHGVEKLRVADCSVLPFLIRAHTAATCIMVGEMVSDFIKNYILFL